MSDTTYPGLGTPRRHRSRKANFERFGNAEAAVQAGIDLRAANLAKAIRQAVDAAPPLSAEQRLALAGLLVGGAR